MILSIHQPNFLPWIPFFEKIRLSDIFVIMGNCQFEKNGYQNRFFYNQMWNTMSVSKGLSKIVDKKYSNYEYDWEKIKRRLSKDFPVLHSFDDLINRELYDTNKNIILKICSILDIKTTIVEDFPTNKVGSERLLEICLKYHCDTYLSGPSGKKYLNQTLFNEHGLNISYFNSSQFNQSSILTIL